VSLDLRAWDPFGNMLQIGALEESWTDERRELADQTQKVIWLYEGKQDTELFRRFEVLFKHPRLIRRYKELARTDNIVKPLVEKVSTIGTRPVRIIWDTKKDQEIWDEIATKRLGSRAWDKFLPFLAQEVKLCKNILVTVGWDPAHSQIELSTHYPNTCDVGWQAGNQAWDYPDSLSLLNRTTPRGSGWDLYQGISGQHYDFVTGQVYEISPSGGVSYLSDLPIVNGAPLRPFTVFRSCLVRGRGFWVWDGQRELVSGQTDYNWLWTCEKVTIHCGAFKMPLLKGRWTDPDGKLQEILLDQTEVLIAPIDPLGKDPGTIEFVGPDNGANLQQIRESRGDVMQSLASSFHMDGEAIVSDNHGAASGYSLRVQKWALNESHDKTANQMRPEISALVAKMREVWDLYNPGRRFTDSGTYEVLIPSFRSGETTGEEVDADSKAINARFVTRRSVLAKYNPGLTSEEYNELEDEGEMLTPEQALTAQSQGVLTIDETRAMLGLPPMVAPAAPANTGEDNTHGRQNTASLAAEPATTA